MGDGRFFLKTSEPLSLMTTFRLVLISARSISLDCTFNFGLIDSNLPLFLSVVRDDHSF
jgi:hypothetical protein